MTSFCGVYLNELGGTGDGIIGALAGVALRMGGRDGRFRGQDAVDPPEFIKTVLREGRSMLPLIRKPGGWRTLTREETKEMFP